MLILTILSSVLFWSTSAVLFSRRNGSLSTMSRLGRWFFAVSTLFTVLLWFFVPIAQADRGGDSRVTAVFPGWYDSALEMWIPNAMLAVASSGAWGATGAGLFLRFKLYSLFGFCWYYMAEVLPWGASARAHAGNVNGSEAAPYLLRFSDVWPLVFTSAASIVLFLVMYAFIAYLERQLRGSEIPRMDAKSAA